MHHLAETAPPRSVTAPQDRCWRLCAFHHVNYCPPCPHRRSGGQRLPHSCTVFIVTTGHFRRFSFARHLRFRRYPDSVCDTLKGQGPEGWSRPTLSWQLWSRRRLPQRSARQPGRSAVRGSSNYPDTALVDCSAFLQPSLSASSSHQL